MKITIRFGHDDKKFPVKGFRIDCGVPVSYFIDAALIGMSRDLSRATETRKVKMNALPIGKGLLRIIVRSKAKRERLAKIPEVRIEGARVIFPEWLAGNIKRLVEPSHRKKRKKPIQTTLFE